jgi:hypothetical protein
MCFVGSNEDNSIQRITDCDVVLTTFSELMRSIPWPDKKTLARWKNQKLNRLAATKIYIEEHMDEAGFLHRVDWYRVCFQLSKS